MGLHVVTHNRPEPSFCLSCLIKLGHHCAIQREAVIRSLCAIPVSTLSLIATALVPPSESCFSRFLPGSGSGAWY